MSWQAIADSLRAAGHSGREIAKRVGKSKSTVNDYFKSKTNRYIDQITERDLKKFVEDAPDFSGLMCGSPDPLDEHPNQRILFISDMHIPYHNKGLFPFLEGLKERYNPTRVICLGDELDKHALSFHDSDPDLDSAGPELERSKPVIRQLEALFPEMDLIDSNHGSLAYRKAKASGLPRAYLKGYNEVLEVGPGWKWHFDMTLDLPDGQQVYVHHGKSSSALKVAQSMGMSHVCGHFHESFGIQYYSTPSKLLWGMNAGCLIDRKSLAFAYNNNNLKRPVVGTGLIINGVPILEAMPL